MLNMITFDLKKFIHTKQSLTALYYLFCDVPIEINASKKENNGNKNIILDNVSVIIRCV